MKKLTYIFAIAISLSHSISAQPKDIVIGQERSLYSEILGEERPYLVSLPASYNDIQYEPQNYPVLYLLDGDARFQSATGAIQFMSPGMNGNSQIPEMIIVGIPNTERTRDLTPTTNSDGIGGGGDDFLRFIRDELAPTIESNHRTMPFRVVVGHSLGGLLAFHSMMEMPDIFDAYISIDPSLQWDDQILVSRLKENISNSVVLRGSAYIAFANNPGSNNPMELAIREFSSLLASINSDVLHSNDRYFANEDHASVPLLGLYHGLLYIFEGYNPFTEAFFLEPSIESITTQYRQLSERLGVEFKPPEEALDQIGRIMFYNVGNEDVGIEIFELNASTHSESFHAHSRLGEAYTAKGDSAKAIEHYERSLSINPENEDAQLKLNELMEQ